MNSRIDVFKILRSKFSQSSFSPPSTSNRVESRIVYPNAWRVVNLVHILLMLAHWFGCFYFLLSESEGFQSDWSYPYPEGDFATLTRKYLGSLYWSTLTLTTIGDLPTPETNAEWVSIYICPFHCVPIFYVFIRWNRLSEPSDHFINNDCSSCHNCARWSPP